MLNRIWFGLLVIGILYGFGKASWNSLRGSPPPESAPALVDTPAEAHEEPPDLGAMGKQLNTAMLDAAKLSVEICIGLIGIMALWLGLLRIAQEAGLVDALARLLRPAMRWLFPDVPDGHPAQGAMLMNISANMLGLENAATPLGLKAMRELQSLNPQPDTATNAMVMFLAINTSNVTLIPFVIIGYRATAGSTNPAGPLIPMILTTAVATIVAIATTRILSRWPRFAATSMNESPAAQEPTP